MRQGKVNRALAREHTSYSKHPLLTTRETTLHLKQVNQDGLERVNLTQMTIISTIVGRNPLGKME